MGKISRRTFLEGTGATIAAATAVPAVVPHLDAQSAPASGAAARTRIRLTVNGSARQIEVEDRWSLAETLRDKLGLTGTKIGCDRGECGACTVILDGRTVYSCSYLAVWADGKQIRTVEGLAQNGKLSPLQQSFVDHDAPQCGYCTSGQLMSATALLAANPKPTEEQARTAMTGNLCRCANYHNYVAGVVAVGNPAWKDSRVVDIPVSAGAA